MDIKTELLDFYSREGLNLIPLKYGDKKPAIRTWKEYQQRRITKEEINALFLQEKQHNIGVVCGAISDNLYVLDFDTEEIFHKFFTKTDGLTVVKTGRGYHVYFKAEKPVKTLKMLDSEEREIATLKGEGSYVVGPPSLHQLGSTYEFIQRGEIPRITGDVRQQVKERAKEIGLIVPKDKIDIEGLLKGVLKGNRDNALLYLIHFLRRADILKENALKICEVWNKKNKPPLEDVRSKIEYHYTLPTPYHYFYTLDPGIWTIVNAPITPGVDMNGSNNDLICKKRSKNKKVTEREKEEFDYKKWREDFKAQKPLIRKIECAINYFDDLGICYFYIPAPSRSEGTKISPLIAASSVIPVRPEGLVLNGEFPNAPGLPPIFPQAKFLYGAGETFLKPQCLREMEQCLREHVDDPILLYKAQKGVEKNDFSSCTDILNSISFKNIIIKLVSKSEFYLDFEDKRYNKFLICWILGTYVLPVFTYYPILTLFGLRNTGKSTIIDYVLNWAFNSGGNTIMSSKSAFFRDIHVSKGVFAIDHYEKVKKDSEYYQWISLALEGGWNKNSFIRISEKEGDTFKPKDYSIFAPYIIGTRRLTDVFEEKGIVLDTEGTKNAIFKERCDKMSDDPEFADFIHFGLVFGLLFGKKIKHIYQNFDELHELNSRAYNIIKPILSVAKLMPEGYYDDVKSLLLELMKKREEEREDIEELLLLYLAANEHIATITLSELKDVMDRHYPLNNKNGYHPNAIKSDMRKLKIDKKQKKNPVTYYLDRKAINAKIKTRGLEKKLEEWEKVREKNVCDGCGQEAYTSEYESGVWLCDECRKLEEQRGGEKRL